MHENSHLLASKHKRNYSQVEPHEKLLRLNLQKMREHGIGIAVWETRENATASTREMP